MRKGTASSPLLTRCNGRTCAEEIAMPALKTATTATNLLKLFKQNLQSNRSEVGASRPSATTNSPRPSATTNSPFRARLKVESSRIQAPNAIILHAAGPDDPIPGPRSPRKRATLPGFSEGQNSATPVGLTVIVAG